MASIRKNPNHLPFDPSGIPDEDVEQRRRELEDRHSYLMRSRDLVAPVGRVMIDTVIDETIDEVEARIDTYNNR